MRAFPPDIDKDFILSRVTQEEIFERYLGVQVRFGTFFKSPLRDDRKPTCTFMYTRNGRVWMTDWSGHFSGDCFNLVQFMYGCGFKEACEKIASDFNLTSKSPKVYQRVTPLMPQVRDSADIRIRWRDWNVKDEEFWREFGITKPLLNFFKVAP